MDEHILSLVSGYVSFDEFLKIQTILQSLVPPHVEYICDTLEKTQSIIGWVARCDVPPETVSLWVYPEYWNPESVKYLQDTQFRNFNIYPVDLEDSGQWIYIPPSKKVQSGFCKGIRIVQENGHVQITNTGSTIICLPRIRPLSCVDILQITGRFKNYQSIQISNKVLCINIQRGDLTIDDIEHICTNCTNISIINCNIDYKKTSKRIPVRADMLTVSPNVMCCFTTITTRLLEIVLDNDLTPFDDISTEIQHQMRKSKIGYINIIGSLHVSKRSKMYDYMQKMFEEDVDSFELPTLTNIDYVC